MVEYEDVKNVGEQSGVGFQAPGESLGSHTALVSVWMMEERKRREVDPTFAMLEECLAEMKKSRDSDKYTKERLLAMQEFFATANKCYEQTRGLSTSAFRKLAGMGGWVLKALKLG